MVYLYDLAGMTFMQRLSLPHHLGRVLLSVNVKRDRPLLFCSNSVDQGTLKVFNVEDQKYMGKPMQCHEAQILQLASDLEGKFLITCSASQKTLRLWNVDTGAKIASYALESAIDITGLALSQQGRIAALLQT